MNSPHIPHFIIAVELIVKYSYYYICTLYHSESKCLKLDEQKEKQFSKTGTLQNIGSEEIINKKDLFFPKLKH